MFHIALLVSWSKWCWYIDIHPSLFGDNLATLPHKKIGTVNCDLLWFYKEPQVCRLPIFRLTQIPSLQNGFTHFSKVLPTKLLNVLRKKNLYIPKIKLRISNCSSPKIITQRWTFPWRSAEWVLNKTFTILQSSRSWALYLKGSIDLNAKSPFKMLGEKVTNWKHILMGHLHRVKKFRCARIMSTPKSSLVDHDYKDFSC